MADNRTRTPRQTFFWFFFPLVMPLGVAIVKMLVAAGKPPLGLKVEELGPSFAWGLLSFTVWTLTAVFRDGCLVHYGGWWRGHETHLNIEKVFVVILAFIVTITCGMTVSSATGPLVGALTGGLALLSMLYMSIGWIKLRRAPVKQIEVAT